MRYDQLYRLIYNFKVLSPNQTDNEDSLTTQLTYATNTIKLRGHRWRIAIVESSVLDRKSSKMEAAVCVC